MRASSITKLKPWRASVPALDGRLTLVPVRARTKSEARARVKTALGLGSKARLPAGVTLEPVR